MVQILRRRARPRPVGIAGPAGWGTISMDKLVTDIEIRKMVKWIGYVPDEVLPALYRKAFALIFPSVYEGFGMPVLEAMSCGCPVAMSSAGSLPEIGGDCATYFNPRSSDSIARNLSKFLIDPHLRAYMRASGLNHVKKFTWESTARATLDVYRRVLDPGCAPHPSGGVAFRSKRVLAPGRAGAVPRLPRVEAGGRPRIHKKVKPNTRQAGRRGLD